MNVLNDDYSLEYFWCVHDSIDWGDSDDVLEDAGDAEDDGPEELEEHQEAEPLEDLHPHGDGHQGHADADRVVSRNLCTVVLTRFLVWEVDEVDLQDRPPGHHEEMGDEGEGVPKGLEEEVPLPHDHLDVFQEKDHGEGDG